MTLVLKILNLIDTMGTIVASVTSTVRSQPLHFQ